MQLDRASCLISANEIDYACSIACDTLADTSDVATWGVVWLRAEELDDMCRALAPQLETTHNLHQLVTQAAKRSPFLPRLVR